MIKAKKIEWEDLKEYKPYYWGYINEYFLFSIYKPILSKEQYRLEFKIIVEMKPIVCDSLEQAKQKAQEILDKFVNEIAEVKND